MVAPNSPPQKILIICFSSGVNKQYSAQVGLTVVVHVQVGSFTAWFKVAECVE